jgi:hypothetical protein
MILSGVCLASACEEDEQSRMRGVNAPLTQARLSQLQLTRHIPDQIRHACTEARQLAQVRVVCPRLIPDIELTKIEGLWGAIIFQEEPRVWMLSFTNAGGFYGRPLRGVGHWIAGGGKATIVEKWILSGFTNEVKGNAVLVRTIRESGRRVRIYRFPSYPAGGVNGSHWGAFVDIGDEIFFASLHGERYIDAAVQIAIDLAIQADR